MKVGIIGAGSIGLLFASYISKYYKVTVYTRTENQASQINENGIILQKKAERTVSFVKALPISKWKGTEDVTLITVKQYQLTPVLEIINQLPDYPDNLLFLQNGMGHLKWLKELKNKNIFVGTVEHGALKENAFTVSHNGKGATNVAPFRGDFSFLQNFSAAVPSDFPIHVQEDYYSMLMNKLIVNAVINPLTSILHVKNGELIQNEHFFRVLKNLFDEISFILNLDHPEEHLRQVMEICKKTAENRSSMLKDIEANRLTEVDAILGFILEEANKQEKQAPLLENVYHFIKGKEPAKGGVL
ncbi:2-dehydropantoate 2-reductase [Bacillus sp. SLBN-46]|uniref:2-dehydropantoate 2-reductase n=1 Tax=Bacillus sp. SLBN-46 TaxID=3042283 RepID=UPI0028559130|nr:2-dehydropantoate 2-reductase [Bacillus sp. SLBN-46]MDR6124288.1 2-dehydropantoate 2-reductase [Bacillus sp. SLBN-46]